MSAQDLLPWPGHRARPSLLTRPERHWCAYCDRPATSWDHVEPWSQSRDNSSDNIVAACHRCNNQKGDRPLVLFLAERALQREKHWEREYGRIAPYSHTLTQRERQMLAKLRKQFMRGVA